MTGYSDLWINANTYWTFGVVVVGILIVCGLGWAKDKMKKGDRE